MVRSTSGEYLFTVGSPGSKFIAGEAEFTYSVSVIGTNYRESLTTNERVNQSIIIEVGNKIIRLLLLSYSSLASVNYRHMICPYTDKLLTYIFHHKGLFPCIKTKRQ